MGQVFIDTNVPMYAAGVSHPLREPCQRVIRAIAMGDLDAVTNTEVFQEILYRYLHINQHEKGFLIFDHFHQLMLGHILPVEDADIVQARRLAERYSALGPRDLIHLAVIERYQIQNIITTDKDFDHVSDIQRIPPDEF
ncbi:MAG: VapC toxin family PIN domain ribonuclease [Chloroflexi bacterium]|nr:MAG: VapC toxin family PIN domain ribonuclease [Chloroflexota bacterium]